MTYQFTIPGAPVTKKNSPRVFRNGKRTVVLPSAPYERWARTAVLFARAEWNRNSRQPIAAPVRIAATFFRARRTGDLVNFLQAVADVLEDAGVVVDDKWIVSWDGSRLDHDPKCPRVEVVIAPLEGVVQ